MDLSNIPPPATDLDEGIVEDEEWLAGNPRNRFDIQEHYEMDGYTGARGYAEKWMYSRHGEFMESKYGDMHLPVFDCDHDKFHLRPSRSPGHYHLFYDDKVSWRDYKRVLKAMSKAGMIDKHWVNMTLARQNGVVRAWWPSDWIQRKRAEADARWYARHGGGYY